MAPLQGPIWIAKRPQGPGCIGEALYPRVSRTGQMVGPGGCWGSYSASACSRCVRAEANSPSQYNVALGQVGHREGIRILDALGQPHQLFRQLTGRL